MTPEEKRARNRERHEKRKARMAEDPEFAARVQATRRRASQKYNESNRERLNAEARERMRAARATPEGRLRNVYGQQAFRARKKGLPVDGFGEWLAALPPRPEDTDLWTWDLRAIDPAKGVTAGNYRWVKSLKDKILDNKLGDFNTGNRCSAERGKARLSKIAKRDGLDTMQDLARSRAASMRENRADIDHEANVGAFFGYSLRVIALEYHHCASRKAPRVHYVCRCSACGAVFSRNALRFLGTRKYPASTACPHCQASATKSAAQAKNSGYYEFKQMLKNITVREDVLKNSHSDYGIRNRDMNFCEYCIDADLLGYGDTLREIYAI